MPEAVTKESKVQCPTSNVGFERGGDQEFIQFLAVAKGSCGEVRAQLYVALDQNYFSLESFETLFENGYRS